jgi:hypothetical protein
MHSNIYGLITLNSPKAIEVEAFNENSIEYEDVSYFADYFKNSESDLKDDVKWLTKFLNLSEEEVINDNGVFIIKLTKERVKEFLEKQYDKFMNYVDSLDFEKFVGDAYTLKEYVEDQFGFHIYNDRSMYNLDEFMRDLYRWHFKDTDTLYFQVNGVLDYHF